ncbi:heterogeneous nuclear ribonucleoproteins C1/C2-like [Petaurus breviceps papuanus]|uniref:heterogeneous nuclear ribonucleoproteins C1/C2-like n=1 Tax=Petaurus breviceps papuanus TaxID=3040969 RepID=UPI0036DCBCF1
MSGVFQGEKEASDDHGGASSPSQQYWDTNVPDLTCEEESLDDDSLVSELAMETSASKDVDVKGMMPRKGKVGAISKGKQRASTVKCGKGKGDDKPAAKKDLGKNNQQQAKSDAEKETESSGDEGDNQDLGYYD